MTTKTHGEHIERNLEGHYSGWPNLEDTQSLCGDHR